MAPPAQNEDKTSGTSPAEEFKTVGNDFLKAGNLKEAVEAYTCALDADKSLHAVWSNRSLARLKLGNAAGALADADQAVGLAPSWPKGFFRRAKALEALGRPRAAAEACKAGEAGAKGAAASELKELRRLGDEMAAVVVAGAIDGWWHGKVSATLGGYEQEFHFMPDGKLECVVYGQPVLGTYLSKDVETSETKPLRGGLDVSLDGGTLVAYLFRIEAGELHLCCPMKGPEDRPRSFDGPGYVAMRPGRFEAEEGDMTEGQRVLQYLTEMSDIMDSMMLNSSSGSGLSPEDLEERMDDKMGNGGLGNNTLAMEEITGAPRLEDQARQLEYNQRQEAMKLRFAGPVADATARLVSGEAKAADLYPDDAEQMERILRNFRATKAPAPEKEQPQLEDQPQLKTAPEPALPTPATKEVVPLSPTEANVATAAGARVAPPRATPSSCCGCFAGVGKR